MKVTGLSFIDLMIGDVVRDVVNSDYKCEIDPAKLQPDECIDGHWQTLTQLLDVLWEGIEGAARCCPLMMRQTFAGIRRAAGAFYSEHGAFEQVQYSCISGFVFLRLLCPAMLAPKSFGLVGQNPCASSLRVLTLMAKGIQCAANLTDFALKEPYMQPMNSFVQRCIPKLKQFIDDIADDSVAVPDTVKANSQSGSNASDLLAIDGDRELAALCTFVSSSSFAIQTAIATSRHHFSETCPTSPTAATTAFPSVPRQLSISSSTNTLLGSELSPSKLAVDTFTFNRGEPHAPGPDFSSSLTGISPTGTAVELMIADSTQGLQKLLHCCGFVQSCVNACIEDRELPVVDSPSSPEEF
ncbi:GTPase activating factor [Coemansia aciculifera]|uniref:GTPase activating factor n=1 Tax=Coemansia aciculifera TaxID=417176 RepID=A0ACC1M2F0_9FUNG|nr:GTPase activating factor [Coemansia aciculifera]